MMNSHIADPQSSINELKKFKDSPPHIHKRVTKIMDTICPIIIHIFFPSQFIIKSYDMTIIAFILIICKDFTY